MAVIIVVMGISSYQFLNASYLLAFMLTILVINISNPDSPVVSGHGQATPVSPINSPKSGINSRCSSSAEHLSVLISRC